MFGMGPSPFELALYALIRSNPAADPVDNVAKAEQYHRLSVASIDRLQKEKEAERQAYYDQRERERQERLAEQQRAQAAAKPPAPKKPLTKTGRH